MLRPQVLSAASVRCLALASLAALAVAAAPAERAVAAGVAEQKTDIRRAGTYLRSVRRMVKAERKEDAAEAFGKAQELLVGVAAERVEPKLKRSFDRAADLLAEVHTELSAAGIKTAELAPLDSSAAPKGEPATGEGRFNPNQVSFVLDVAPMLVAKCGSCHIDGKRGGFSVATYEDLMRGVDGGGRVLVPGDGQTSMITELIVSGDMPRGGRAVSPAEVQKLVFWITQGAKFDGQDPAANLRSLKPGGEQPAAAMPAPKPQAKLARPTGKETVSFATDVAPILTARCAECHGANRPRSGFSVADFARLLRGGDGGAVIKAGEPDASTLVRRVTGADTPRMPMNRAPLSPAQIKTLETWVREGATFDGPDAETPLPRVTGLVRAERATPEELNAIRADIAARQWRLALPDERLERTTTDRFLIVGNLPSARLEEIGGQTETVADDTLKLLGHPSGEPLAKGRVTVYAFDKRIDYSEFALMVQRREAPKGERGTSGYDVVDAYAAVQMGIVAEPGDGGVLAEQVATAYLNERTTGRLPGWFVEGVARAATARLAPKDARVVAWQETLPTSLAGLKNPTDLFTNRLAPKAAGVLRYGFAEGLMRKPGRVRAVISAVADGQPIEAAFKREYRYTPKELAPLWVSSKTRGVSSKTRGR
ncbi:MAG: c-type cytochrome domain-containing protein [Planctomycetota bacterium]